MQVGNDYIDELFARKLGNLEATPPEDGWIRIENELYRRSRMTWRFWMMAASVALLLSVTAAVVYMQTNTVTTIAVQESASQYPEKQSSHIDQGFSIAQEPVENTISQGERSIEKTTVLFSESVVSNAIREDDNTFLQETTATIAIRDNVAVADVREDAIPHSSVYIDSWDELLRVQPIKANRLELLSDRIARLKPKTPEKKAEEPFTVAASRMSIYDDIAYMDISDISSKSRTRNRWEITGQFAPVYQSYRVISNVPAGLRKSDFDDAESSLMAYSGGITLSFNVFSRLSVQTGILYSQTGQSINNLISVTNMYAAVSSINPYSKNFVRTSSGSVIVASNLKSDTNTTYSSYFNAESQATNAVSGPIVSNPLKYRLFERIDYLEIPLMLRYRIIDRKLNFYVLTGMSANVLIDTNVFVDNGTELVKGGTILMARPVNYSSTFGLGFGYQMMKNLLIGFEPSFKYYLQPYTTSSQIGSNPYVFGLFTGVVYSF